MQSKKERLVNSCSGLNAMKMAIIVDTNVFRVECKYFFLSQKWKLMMEKQRNNDEQNDFEKKSSFWRNRKFRLFFLLFVEESPTRNLLANKYFSSMIWMPSVMRARLSHFKIVIHYIQCHTNRCYCIDINGQRIFGEALNTNETAATMNCGNLPISFAVLIINSINDTTFLFL